MLDALTSISLGYIPQLIILQDFLHLWLFDFTQCLFNLLVTRHLSILVSVTLNEKYCITFRDISSALMTGNGSDTTEYQQ